MSQTTCLPPAFTSKDDFFARGLVETSLEEPLDCSICREPLVITTTPTAPIPASQQPRVNSTCLPRFSISQATDTNCMDPALQGYAINNQAAEVDLSSQDSTSTQPTPETPIQIAPCAHIFGSTCLHTWFSTTSSNRCPICNTMLFPERHIHLAFREPTRAMRADFADIVERVLVDPATACSIREDLMGEWTRVLMRELAVEIHRSRGWEVTWEYVDVDAEGRVFEDGDGEGSGEESDGEDEEDEMDSGSEYEEEDESDGDDMEN
ncbi:hypothetical protein CC86DRAFT_402584 [Ophiobolus disseminans]|uniref:RING-type domain-containing protein n=1 Tax=Ophiobolus disseminans TaxID=1469910 RepID=A0A6A7AB65_9PLEO|nr:hypothetical protein CC86DRAFT_402584 [Ophiobolus disseminans]